MGSNPTVSAKFIENSLVSDDLPQRECVYATLDDTTGDVVLSNRPGMNMWGDFFELLRSVDVPADFMAERPLNVVSSERDIFDEEAT